jgi:hypothetical protein
MAKITATLVKKSARKAKGPTKKELNFAGSTYSGKSRPMFEEDDDREDFDEDPEREDGNESDEDSGEGLSAKPARRKKPNPSWSSGVNTPHAIQSQLVRFPLGSKVSGHSTYVDAKGNVYRASSASLRLLMTESSDKGSYPLRASTEKALKPIFDAIKDTPNADLLLRFSAPYINQDKSGETYQWWFMFDTADVLHLIVGLPKDETEDDGVKLHSGIPTSVIKKMLARLIPKNSK